MTKKDMPVNYEFEKDFFTIIKSIKGEKIIHHFISEQYKLRINFIGSGVCFIYLYDRINNIMIGRLDIYVRTCYSHVSISDRPVREEGLHKFYNNLLGCIGKTPKDLKLFLDELRITLL